MSPTRKRGKLRLWNWHDEVYDTGVLLFCGSFDETREKVREMLGDEPAEAFNTDKRPLGRTCWIDCDKGTGVLVWLAKFDRLSGNNLATLVHELHHATFYVLQARGLAHVDASEEAFAYHKSWLFRQCYGRLTGQIKDGKLK